MNQHPAQQIKNWIRTPLLNRGFTVQTVLGEITGQITSFAVRPGRRCIRITKRFK